MRGQHGIKLIYNQKNKKWVSLAEFPVGTREQATSVFINDNTYVFGGIGKNKQGLTQIFNDVHMYKPESNTWIKLMSHAPLGMAGNVAFAQNNKVFIIGGVNQNIFNGYFEDLNDALGDKNIISRINHNYFGKKLRTICSVKRFCHLSHHHSNGVFPVNLHGWELLVQQLLMTVKKTI